MLTEIIIYIALFASLFSGAFVAAFQTVDAVQYLETQKKNIEAEYYTSARLDSLVRQSADWSSLPRAQIIETATSSSRVLILTSEINQKNYDFYYVQEK